MTPYIVRRLVLLIPQLLLILVVTFLLIRMLPGDPARLQLGPLAPEEGVQALREQMRLDESLPQQFVAYVDRLFHGDLGRSWVNGSSVGDDLKERMPATLELIFLSLIAILVIFVPLGIVTASRSSGIFARLLKRLTAGYGLIAGALPDFWLGLLLIFLFFTTLGWAPGPEGRLGIGETPPEHITGSYVVDSLMTGKFSTFSSALAHLALPVATLVFVFGSVVYKTTWSSMSISLRSDSTTYLEGFGLSRARIFWYAFRNAAPPVIVMTGIISGYLLGGAVLVETVFNLNGVGQYAVQAVVSADYAPIQGFVLVAATFTTFVYLVVDLIYFAADPRVRVRNPG